jgi:hypothetical protein
MGAYWCLSVIIKHMGNVLKNDMRQYDFTKCKKAGVLWSARSPRCLKKNALKSGVMYRNVLPCSLWVRL